MSTLLIDTHVLLWVELAPNRLSTRVLNLLEDIDVVVMVSSITAWEIAIKHASGKLPEASGLLKEYHKRLAQYQFLQLPFEASDALQAAALPHQHKDPFDRGLTAQSLLRQWPIVSADSALDGLGALRIW
jgi:PIN domain nuclease of toxin-antitoxin system